MTPTQPLTKGYEQIFPHRPDPRASYPGASCQGAGWCKGTAADATALMMMTRQQHNSEMMIPVTDLIPASAVPPLSTVLLLGTAYEAQRPQSRRQNNSRNKDSRREDSETRKTNILITFYR